MVTAATNGTQSDAAQPAVSRYALLFGITVLTIGVLGFIGLPDRRVGGPMFLGIAITVLSGVILLLALRVSNIRGAHRRTAEFAVAVVVIVAVLANFTNSDVVVDVISIVWIVLLIATPALVLVRVLGSDQVTLQTIVGSFCVFLLMALSFTYIYVVIDRHAGMFGSSVDSTEFIYFSFVTLTTLGYGDLTPINEVGRMTAVTEAVLGQIYLVVIVARLVAAWRPKQVFDGRKSAERTEDDQ